MFSDTEYSVKVTYSYDLNDGTGEQTTFEIFLALQFSMVVKTV